MKNGHWGWIILGFGIALAGWFVGDGFIQGRSGDRYVTVKGVSEREVKADIALWPLRFVATDDELSKAQNVIKQSHEKILAFLERHGIDPSQAEMQRLEVNDRLAELYRSGTTQSRYIVNQSVMVRSDDPEAVAAASQAVGELVEAGVVLSSTGGYSSGPTFLFTGLNELKPEMIAEATERSREAASQFAEDSGSKLGGIRRANQGVFVILARDRAPGITESSELNKTVRVVSTIQYFLED